MHSGVKTIFKVLLGTILIMVLGSLTVEYFNITNTTNELTQMMKVACRQTAVLVSQETYKNHGSGGAVDLYNIRTSSGGTYVNGNIYGTGGIGDIYNRMYNTTEFNSWLNGSGSTVDNTKIIFGTLGTVSGAPKDLWKDCNDLATKTEYRNRYVTPLNSGVPYLPPEVMNKAFKWNMAALSARTTTKKGADNLKMKDPAFYNEADIKDTLKNGSFDTIRPHDVGLTRSDNDDTYTTNQDGVNAGGNPYVHYNGFGIYANEAKITELEYNVYDVRSLTEDDGIYLAGGNLGNIVDSNLSTGHVDGSAELGGYDEEEKYICTVTIRYEVPIRYDGITPLGRIINSFRTNFVTSKIDDTSSTSQLKHDAVDGVRQFDGMDPTAPDALTQWVNAKENYSNKVDNNKIGEVVYYVVR